MSYDLLFRSRHDCTPINDETFLAYFSGRLNYQIQGGRQAWYSNEDTGVYFSFELSDATEDPEAEPSDAAFNLNFYRSHIFGLEAEPEVASFVATFNPLIIDPQGSMGGDGYSRENFLNGWNSRNEFGFRAVTDQPDVDPPQFLPSEAIERFWKWNLARRRLQEQVGESIFVPRIMFLRSTKGVASLVVWEDAIPILLPEVDFVLIMRHELAPQRFLRRKKDQALVPWSQVLPALASYKTLGEDLAYRRLDYSAAPSELISWVKNLSAYRGQFNGIPVDQILDRELLTHAKAT